VNLISHVMDKHGNNSGSIAGKKTVRNYLAFLQQPFFRGIRKLGR